MLLSQDIQERLMSRVKGYTDWLGSILHSVDSFQVCVLLSRVRVFLSLVEPNSRNNKAEGANALKTSMQRKFGELSCCVCENQQSVAIAQLGSGQGDDRWRHLGHA